MNRVAAPASLFLLLLFLWSTGPATGQETPRTAPQEPTATASTGEQESDEAIAEVEEELQTLRQRLEAQRAGDTKVLVTGFGFAGYADGDESISSFAAGFNPILLWKVNDRILFEAETEMELEDGETAVELEFADVSYLVNRYLTFTAGLFLTPLGTFNERLHPAWINKLPDAPLAFGHDGLIPGSSLGVQLRGGAAAGRTKLNYALFVANGPMLNDGEEDPEEAGMLEGGNFEDNNDDKAIGGRVGFLPIPNLEIGYGFQRGKVGDTDSEARDIGANLQVADFTYFKAIDAIRGQLDVRGEWIRSDVDRGEEMLDFDNQREGGYAQLAYRPSGAGQRWVKNLEAVVRFDYLDRPEGAPENLDEDRWTYGLDYWLSASTALKFAYQTTDRSGSGGMGMDDEEQAADGKQDAFLFQLAIGF